MPMYGREPNMMDQHNHGHSHATQDGSLVDPVCGMTVAVDPANHPVEHDGRTYYFCCPGCRYSFKKDPASFLSQEVSC